LNEVLSKLKAQDAEAAISYRNDALTNDGPDKKPRIQVRPQETKLLQIVRLWARIFPSRTVDFSTYQPRATNKDTGGALYGISTMSDGEEFKGPGSHFPVGQ